MPDEGVRAEGLAVSGRGSAGLLQARGEIHRSRRIGFAIEGRHNLDHVLILGMAELRRADD
jgi:hypothetical protein